MENRRKRVLEEMLSTEESYQKYLQDCLGIWIRPIIARSQHEGCSISKEDARILASNMEEIYARQAPFLVVLKERMANFNPDTTTIGDLFQELSWWDLYATYTENYHAQTAKVKEVQKTKDFPDHTENADAPRIPLESYLVMPVSRVPRYILLLQELLKHTPTDHPDYALLLQAVAEVKAAANKINETFARAERN